MLDIKFIRENKELIKKNSEARLSLVNIDELLELDVRRRDLLQKIEEMRANRNAKSKTKPTPEIITELKKLGGEITNAEKELAKVEPKYIELLMAVPNLTHPDVKVSTEEDDNVVLEHKYEPTKFDFTPKDHVQISEALDLIDFDRGTKIAGAKFYYLKNEAAILELALTRYAFDIALKHGFTPFITPDLAKREIVENMGYNPRGESTQIYNIENSDLSLIGTAEITMGGYHKDETFKESDLPKKYVALSHCFRTEAGAYSKFSKGIFRVHQFTKVEMFQFTTPKNSQKAHKELLDIEKEIFDGLEIPYRVIDHCTADLGAPSHRTYDLEAWMPGKPNKDGGSAGKCAFEAKDDSSKAKIRKSDDVYQEKISGGAFANLQPEGSSCSQNDICRQTRSMGDWAEITSASNCTDYQSRGLNIKYKAKDGAKEFVHMLNGTAVTHRAIIGILENFQKADGSIKIPAALAKYTGFDAIKSKK